MVEIFILRFANKLANELVVSDSNIVYCPIPVQDDFLFVRRENWLRSEVFMRAPRRVWDVFLSAQRLVILSESPKYQCLGLASISFEVCRLGLRSPPLGVA